MSVSCSNGQLRKHGLDVKLRQLRPQSSYDLQLTQLHALRPRPRHRQRPRLLRPPPSLRQTQPERGSRRRMTRSLAKSKKSCTRRKPAKLWCNMPSMR